MKTLIMMIKSPALVLFVILMPGFNHSASASAIFRGSDPSIIDSISPHQNAVSVNKASDISVYFAAPMNVNTINSANIKVYGKLTGYMSCVITYVSLLKRATINPCNNFKTGEEITVSLTSGIQSANNTAIVPFVFQFTAAATAGTGLFTEASLIDSNGNYRTGIAAGDIDSDGTVDLLVGKENSIKVYKNNGTAQFSEFSEINESGALFFGYFNLGDIDNDGDLDILSSNNGILKTFINDGSGLFTHSNTSDGSAGEMSDIDGDGDIDISFNGIYSSFSSWRNIVIEKNNNGVFSVENIYNINSCYDFTNHDLVNYLQITDFNNDGRLDITEYEIGARCVLGFCDGCGSLKILNNLSQNNFVIQTIFTNSNFPSSNVLIYKCMLLSFDKDNDKDADYITPFFNLTNLGNEVFADEGPEPFLYGYSIKGDYDGDGDMDIASLLYIIKNDGNGNFPDYVINNTGLHIYSPLTADFDNNGSLDFAGVNSNSNAVTVLLNDQFITGNIKVAIEGFYNSISDEHNMRDTLRAYLRNVNPPFQIVDSAKAVVDSVALSGSFAFRNAVTGKYYIVLKHRNSIETWSRTGSEIITIGKTFSYDFTSSSSQGYGNNLVQIGSKYCIYSGDTDQNGTVNLYDVLLIYNDASDFLAGYLNSDLNGDGYVDSGDLTVAYNNANNFITILRP